jgi:D-glycero-alpha-D-manno-heptose-7-phosphate kinase
MKACEATAPTRIDLAGGTLDIWPLYLLHPGAVTVNVAIERRAWCRIETWPDGVRLESLDTGAVATAGRLSDLLEHASLSLIVRVMRAIGVEGGVKAACRSGVPAGSGLGGSSALAVAVAAATACWRGETGDIRDACLLIRDAETQCIRVPTGLQDYLAALHGGALAIEHMPGAPRIRRLNVDPERLARMLLLVNMGASRFSGMNNWEIFKKRIDGDSETIAALDEIVEVASEMRTAVNTGDERAMITLLGREWAARRRLAPEVTTADIDRVVDVALAHGGAAKACGAGGGGVVAIMVRPAERRLVSDEVQKLGFDVSDVEIAVTGVSISKTVR